MRVEAKRPLFSGWLDMLCIYFDKNSVLALQCLTFQVLGRRYLDMLYLLGGTQGDPFSVNVVPRCLRG